MFGRSGLERENGLSLWIDLPRKVMWRLFSRYGYLLARHRANALLSLTAIFSEFYLNFYKNRSYDRRRNGEDRLISLMEIAPGEAVFDVGAHHGDYARAFHAGHPHAVLHCFEISPANAQRFREQQRDLGGQLQLHDCGLGSEEGSFQLSEHPSESQIVSLHAIEGNKAGAMARVVRGDAFCQKAGISQIAFLKIDTEGHELEVLKGFGEMLKPETIRCIQFEYNEASTEAHLLLKDFFRLLEPRGYALGKIYPRAVEFGPYSIHLEDHRANNYCAVGKGSELEKRLMGWKNWGRSLR